MDSTHAGCGSCWLPKLPPRTAPFLAAWRFWRNLPVLMRSAIIRCLHRDDPHLRVFGSKIPEFGDTRELTRELLGRVQMIHLGVGLDVSNVPDGIQARE